MTVQIEAGARNYEALIGRGLLAQLGARLTSLVRGPRGVVVADENSARLFAAQTLASLHAAGYAPTLITVPAGEGAKSFAQLERVCAEMAAAGLDRTSFVAALGGGVIGDLAGFAAAIYHRGIALVQVPTTLLAQVDSAIGGKTAINLAAGKNLLGAIHQPVLVLADVATLDTLPPREFRQGFAEMVKHAIIADPGMFELLENFQPANLPELIRRNLALKAAIVAR
ncbi:MAG: 3-dehydroquinate synthase family protein, partial [Chthoniobacterales bacterium]